MISLLSRAWTRSRTRTRSRSQTSTRLNAFVGSCAALLAIGCASDVSGPATLSAPTGVTVTLVSLTSVRVDWTANPANEQVRSYTVLRDGVKVGEATTNSFTDYGLVELQTYRYTVAANGSAGAVSSPSPVTPQSTFTLLDLTGPRVLSSAPAAGATAVAIGLPVTIAFSEPLSAASVTTTSVSLRLTATDAPVTSTVAYTPGATTVSVTPAAALTPSTGYTLRVTTGVKDVSGNQLLTAYSAGFTTAAPIDDTPPTVTSIAPPNGARDVATSTAVSVTFSEALDATSVTESAIALRTTTGGTPVTANRTYNSATRTATLTPVAPLTTSTSYTVSLAGTIRDVAGNPLAAITSTFVTVPPVDNNPPAVTAVTPADGATNVPLTTTVQVLFSEAMLAGSISTSSLTLTRSSDGAPVTATVALDAATNRATLTPGAPLALGTAYTVRVTTDARDVAGNALTAAFVSRFTTVPPDITPPTVISTQPATGSTNVDPNFPVSATFSEPMNASTMTSAALTLRATGTGAAVAGAVAYNAATNTISYRPNDHLDGLTSYTATITTAAKDSAGNALAANLTIVFVTGPVIDNTPPRVLGITPANNAVVADASTPIVVVFSEPLEPASLTTTTFALKVTSSGAPVAGSIQDTPGTNTARFVPSAPLAYRTNFTINLTAGIRDLAGNPVTAVQSAFTTDAPPLIVTAISPADRSSNVGASAPVVVTFSEALNAATLTSSTFVVRNRNTAALVSGAITYNAANKTATFTPAAPYENANGYAVSLTTGITDASGRALFSPFESCFTPGPGTGAAVSMTGFWSGDTACSDIHWHIRLLQSGNTLTLATPTAAPAPQNNCTTTAGDCQLSALNTAGQIALGGVGVIPITAVSGTVNGTSVSFTMTTSNGLTFTFVGAFATATNGNSWLIGTISGATLPAVGMSFERQRP